MKYLNYIFIVIGACVAMYSKVEEQQNQYVLIAGIVLLMIGVYRVSRSIPSKHEQEQNEDVDNTQND